MRYLVDTDWVVDYLTGLPRAVELVHLLAPEGIGISLVTYGEVYEGILYGRDPERAERVFLKFLAGVQVMPLHKSIMRRFAEERGSLRKAGSIIGDTDLLIAATALHYGVSLVTRNVRDFRRVAGLPLYPVQP